MNIGMSDSHTKLNLHFKTVVSDPFAIRATRHMLQMALFRNISTRVWFEQKSGSGTKLLFFNFNSHFSEDDRSWPNWMQLLKCSCILSCVTRNSWNTVLPLFSKCGERKITLVDRCFKTMTITKTTNFKKSNQRLIKKNLKLLRVKRYQFKCR